MKIFVCLTDDILTPIRQPYQTGALASAGGAIDEGVACCATLLFLTLGANGSPLIFFCY